MPSAAVERSHASKMSQLQLRKNGVRKNSSDSYSVASFDNDPPLSATSTNISTIESNFGEDMALALAPALSDKPDEFSVLQISPLQEQLRSLSDENGRLLKLLGEKDYEIQKLKRRNAMGTDADGVGVNFVTGDVAATKIIELSKKIREMTSELNKEQTKNKQMNKQLAEKEDELRVMQSELASVSTLKLTSTVGGNKKKQPSKNLNSLTEDEVAQLREKLESATAKMLEYRAQMETNKLELKKTQKALQNEIGDQFNVHDILSNKNGAGWRGRQQKIIELQSKLQEYKELAANSGLISNSAGNNFVNASLSTSRTNDTLEHELMFMNANLSNTNGSSLSSSNLEDKNKARIKAIDKKKQEELHSLRSEVKTLEDNYTKAQQNLDSSKARNKTLSNETKSLKNQISLLKEKSLHDDELVTALMSQIDVLKEDLKRAIEAEKELSELPALKKTAAQEQVERAIVDQLKQLVSEKESKIQELEQKIAQLQSFQENQTAKEVSASQPFKYRETTQIPQPITRVTSMSSMSNQSRPGSSNINNQPNASNETELKNQENSTLLSAATVEKEKLREFCTVLQKRVDESVDEKIKLEKELTHHKKRTVLLEKQLGAATFSSNSGGGLGSRSRNQMSSSSITSSTISLREQSSNFPVAGMEEMSVKCELLEEEVTSLKNNLQSIMKARDEDFELYRNMIEETKNVFLTALRQIKMKSNSINTSSS